ncbi:MAG: CHAT domain-containing protein [Myxococcota bacterium]
MVSEAIETSDGRPRPVFLSYAHDDREAAERLMGELELWGVPVWKDDRNLRRGDRLDPRISEAIQGARALLLLGTPRALASGYIAKEIGWALKAERRAREAGESFRVIPIRAGADDVPLQRAVGDPEETEASGRLYVDGSHAVEDAVPGVLEALDELPTVGGWSGPAPEPPPRDELILRFRKPRWREEEGKRRVASDLEVVHKPHGASEGAEDGLAFESPLGPVELERLRWYLETYPLWSFGRHLVDADQVENRLPEWGRALYDATLGQVAETAGEFRASSNEGRVVVKVDAGGDDAASSALLALPWELLADRDGYLFADGRSVRVVRRQTRRRTLPEPDAVHRLRVLLVVSRPEDAGFIDARESLTPLAKALAPLGHKVDLHVLPDATLNALETELEAARESGRPYQVVHFDGHGVYDPNHGLGKLVFEHPDDAGRPERRKDLVGADELGDVLAEHRVPLFVLEACQTARSDEAPESSVAAGLLRAGVGSVVAMSHAVLVETARRFVDAFYPALVKGERIGTAMVQAQRTLFLDRRRNRSGEDEWTLEDWFVPVLFQDETSDVPLLPAGPLPNAEFVEKGEGRRRAGLPECPAHGFVGRSREILRIMRLLDAHRSVALLGTGGQGKTALASESARWLLSIRRVQRLAWVSTERHTEARSVLDALGRQLVPGWTSVAALEGEGGDLIPAVRRIQQILHAWRVLLVVDNLETALQDPDPELLPMLRELAETGSTRLLVTSREAPGGLDAEAHRLGPLSPREGRELVERVLREQDLADEAEGSTEAVAWVDRLVRLVRGHPRSLVLLAPEVARRGLKATHDELKPLMEALDRRAGSDADTRESSLLASVRLSLRRLTERERRLARGLVVFRQAVEVRGLAHVLEIEPDEAAKLLARLVSLGLGDAYDIPRIGLGIFLPDPALAPALELGLDGDAPLSDAERVELADRWFDVTRDLIGYLDQQQHTDAREAMQATRLALGELLAWVEAVQVRVASGGVSADAALGGVTDVESLLKDLGRPRALAHVVGTREHVADSLAEWPSHALFEHRRYDVERRLQAGDLPGALEGARALHADAEALADDTYPGAAYDRAVAAFLLGRVEKKAGAPELALSRLETARWRFAALANHSQAAAGMATGCVAERGDCLRDLGRREEAAACYEHAIAEFDAAGRRRHAAVARGQLGTVRMLQGRIQDAVEAHQKARATFDALGEPTTVAVSWHQEGMAWQKAGQHPEAERCYLESLALESQLGDRVGEASTLVQLGHLYDAQGRLEGAVAHFARAAGAFRELQVELGEAVALGNRGDTLRRLGRLDEARADLRRAMELKRAYELNAEPWREWWTATRLEQAAGDAEAAEAARREAVRLYAQYRRAGGAPQQSTGCFVESVRQRIAEGAEPGRLADELPPPERFHEELQPFRATLEAMLRGEPADPDDPQHDYDDVVELRLLRETLEPHAG